MEKATFKNMLIVMDIFANILDLSKEEENDMTKNILLPVIHLCGNILKLYPNAKFFTAKKNTGNAEKYFGDIAIIGEYQINDNIELGISFLEAKRKHKNKYSAFDKEQFERIINHAPKALYLLYDEQIIDSKIAFAEDIKKFAENDTIDAKNVLEQEFKKEHIVDVMEKIFAGNENYVNFNTDVIKEIADGKKGTAKFLLTNSNIQVNLSQYEDITESVENTQKQIIKAMIDLGKKIDTTLHLDIDNTQIFNAPPNNTQTKKIYSAPK